MHEEKIRNNREGEEAEGNPGAEDADAARLHHKPDRSAVRRADRETGAGVRTDGAEPVRVSGGEQAPEPKEGEGADVPAAEVYRVHPQQGHLPPRHQARERTGQGRLHQAGRFRLLQSEGIYSKVPYTEYISTRWYRAPECLMTDGYYDFKMDIWGYGCVLFEMIAKFPLFNGVDELDQIHKINKVLGTPKPDLIDFFKTHASHMGQNQFNFAPRKGVGFDKMLPNASKQLIDLLQRLLAYDPQQRISAKQALRHQYFADVAEQKFRSTIFAPPTSLSKGKQNNEETPEKYTIKKKKTKKHGLIDEEVSSLPPIHQLRLDVKFNLYSSTSKTQDNVFKKTLAQVNQGDRKKGENYMIMGKKFEK